MLLLARFTAKFELVFVLTLENASSLRFHFKANRKSIHSSKKRYWDFQNRPLFERSAFFFMWQSFEILNDFNTLSLKQIFWKTKTFFKKLEYRFLVESTKFESTSFSYKTAISEASVKTNKCWVQNGPITKNGVLPVTTLFFWKNFFSLKNLLWRVGLMYQRPKCPYSYFVVT